MQIKPFIFLIIFLFSVNILVGCAKDQDSLQRLSSGDKNLRYAKLIDADLKGIVLQEVKFKNADLSGADLSGSNLTTVDFHRAKMIGINFEGATLITTYFTHADLSNANMKSTNMEGSYFYMANLTGADLSGSNLAGVMFWQTDLTNVNLEAAFVEDTDFNGAFGLTEEQKEYLNTNGAINVPEPVDEPENFICEGECGSKHPHS